MDAQDRDWRLPVPTLRITPRITHPVAACHIAGRCKEEYPEYLLWQEGKA
ncbi:MAG: hypothetical protein VST67_02815 [Nitrospirota bacterium]|nr:hypothetical protein [Nitrospirota bacterium]